MLQRFGYLVVVLLRLPAVRNIGALIITYTIMGAPHYTYSRMAPKAYSYY